MSFKCLIYSPLSLSWEIKMGAYGSRELSEWVRFCKKVLEDETVNASMTLKKELDKGDFSGYSDTKRKGLDGWEKLLRKVSFPY